MSTTLAGRFVWHDLVTTDPAAAIAFYTRVIGWTITEFDMGGTPYPMWTAGGTPIGGCAPLPPELVAAGVPPHWLGSVAVAGLEASVAEATRLGAAVQVPPSDIPTVGRYAVIADPAGGASLTLFEPGGHAPGHAGPPAPGEFSWHELLADDGARALAFHSALFGWVQAGEFDMGPMGIYRIFGRPGEPPMGGMMTRPPDMPVASWLYYARVEDLGQALARVTAHGGRVLNGPMEVPGGSRVAQCLDPQGGAFALHQVAA